MEPPGAARERSGESISGWVAHPCAATYSSLDTVSALEGLVSEHGIHMKWKPRWKKALGMEAHEDTHAWLPLRRSGVTANGRNTLMVGVSAVVEGDMLDDARDVVGEVLQGG